MATLGSPWLRRLEPAGAELMKWWAGAVTRAEDPFVVAEALGPEWPLGGTPLPDGEAGEEGGVGAVGPLWPLGPLGVLGVRVALAVGGGVAV